MMGLLQETEEPLRSEIVSVRFTSDELKSIEALASHRSVSRADLVRGSVLATVAGSHKPSSELVEIIGLRLMLNNFLRPLAQGKIQTAEEVKALSDSIRERKAGLAQELVDGAKG